MTNVLSLFDGISCGKVALDRAGIVYKNYFASEIDKYAIAISRCNHPDIIRLDDVKNWRTWIIPKIDLLIAGSPCQGLSSSGKGAGLMDDRSALFYVFIEILRELKPTYFLLENVVPQKKEWADEMTKQIGVQPVKINSALVSAQNRNRLYWCNWSVGQPADKGILLKDIIENGLVDREKSYAVDAHYYKGTNLNQYLNKKRRQIVYLPEKSKTITKGSSRSVGGKGGTIIQDPFGWRVLSPVECERLQTLPDGYTDYVSRTRRYEVLGNGWTVDVIKHIFEQNGGLFV